MSTPFKMKGMSFGNLPMKEKTKTSSTQKDAPKKKSRTLTNKMKPKKVTSQKMGLKEGKKLLKEKKTEKFSLHAAQQVKGGPKDYFKVYGGISTDGGKTFTKSRKTKISETEYNSYFPKKKKGMLKESFKKAE
tara:strand:- start:85 stop:483 length:399 start_codon:yes stop_codon:yes gene_type:complete